MKEGKELLNSDAKEYDDNDNIENSNKHVMYTNKFIYTNLIITAVASLTNFTGFSALQNLQSSFHPEVGFVSLCVLYAAFLISSLFLPNLMIYKCGYKYSLAISMVGYTTFTVAQFFPSMWLMIIVAIIVGCSSAVYWASTASTITHLANIYALKNNATPDSINAKFFAIFYIGFRFAQISGNLISSLTLAKGTNLVTTNTSQHALCGVDFCPANSIQDSSGTDHRGSGQAVADYTKVKQLIWIYLSISIAGVILVLGFLSNLKDEENTARNDGTGGKRNSLKKELTAVFPMLSQLTMWKLSITTIGIGLSTAFIYADITQAFVTCAYGIENVGFAMICFGASSCLSSLLIQSIVRKTGFYIVTIIGASVYAGVLVWLFFWDVVRMPKYLVYVTIAMYGMSEVVITSQVHGFCGVLYPKEKAAVFSIFKMYQSLGNTLSFSYGNHLCIRTKLIILMAFLLVGMLLYSHVYYEHKKNLKRNEQREGKNIELKEILKKTVDT